MKAELEQLESIERPKITQQIAEARDKGDLSENAEYDAAKEAQGLLELKISKLQDIIANSKIIEENQIDTSKVSILTTVRLKNNMTKAEQKFTLVPELGRRLLRRAALSVLAVVLFVVSGAGFAWHNIQSRVAWFNVDSILSEDDRPGTKPPDSYDGRAVNLLVLGTDSRSGDNNVDGSEGSDEVSVARSDTALVMHISADRKRVDAVSIPRDTLVDIPECTQ